MYNNNYYWGMDLIWWIVWILFLVWVFAVPYDIPFQRNKKDSPLDILKKHFASGGISEKEYLEKKRILET